MGLLIRKNNNDYENDVLHLQFQNYLKSLNKRNINQILCYAQRFGSILETGDASLLLSLTPAVRRHAMEALTAYSKYTGTYQRWQEIRQVYLLKWTNGNESLASLQRFFNQHTSLAHMIETVKKMMRVLPRQMALVIRHALLTGLRPSEACESVRLIRRSVHLNIPYYNQEQQILQHYLYPDIFLRTTRRAYLSYLSTDNYQQVASLGEKTLPGTPSATHAGVGISTWRCVCAEGYSPPI